jgi:hypothetical protein
MNSYDYSQLLALEKIRNFAFILFLSSLIVVFIRIYYSRKKVLSDTQKMIFRIIEAMCLTMIIVASLFIILFLYGGGFIT